MKNEKPAFAFHEVLLHEVSWFGKTQEHLRIRIRRDEFDESTIEAISFYAKRDLGKALAQLEVGKRINLLGHLERDQFSRGQPVRLRIVAIS
jgi:hypothetical protein